MNPVNVNKEVATQAVEWMMRVRACVKEWIVPDSPHDESRKPLYFDPDHLKRKGFLVAPFIEFWSPSLDETFPQGELQKHQRVYATGFEIRRGSVYSSSIDNYSLDCLMIKFIRHCLVAPEDESFWVINTSLDYWLLAGPYELVMEACKGSLDGAFQEFNEWVRELGDRFEPGTDFAVFISDLYQKTNSEVLKDRGVPK